MLSAIFYSILDENALRLMAKKKKKVNMQGKKITK